MGFIVKNGQVSNRFAKRSGKLSGFVIKNGQASISFRSLPADIVVEETSFGFLTVIGVATADIAEVKGVAKANIAEVMGV